VIKGVVSTQDGISYTFTAVAGRHVTLSVTSPKVSPAGDSLLLEVYDASGGGVADFSFSSSPEEVDFTPTSAEAGTMTVVISPYSYEATGSFTLTYTAG
jgi:hypothetical protein